MASTERDRNTLTLQEWEGCVVEIGDSEFVARLIDLTAGHSHESEEAIIPLDQVSEHDASRMVLGSIFRWVISCERSSEGLRRGVSRITFRDMPRMTERDFRRGKEWAKRIMAAFAYAPEERGTALDGPVGSAQDQSPTLDTTEREA